MDLINFEAIFLSIMFPVEDVIVCVPLGLQCGAVGSKMKPAIFLC
jgi:hypothetical protein